MSLIRFDQVWKKFRSGERHDSLRDLVPAAARRLLGRTPPAADLQAQEFWALRDVSFEVRPGEALGIIGPNGAGKSTVLKLLTRILRPTRGACEIRGRTGALIEVAAGFHPDLTGRENIFLQGAIMGMRRADIARQFDAIVDFAGLQPFIDTPVKRYSSGMNARLGFSIAAQLDPEVLLIDEVLAVGDFSFQQKCFDRLARFRRDGLAIAFVSHNLQAIATLCDRALLLRAGHPPLLGGIAEVTSAYMSSATVQQDARIRVCSTSLTVAETGEPVAAALRPGTRLRLEVEIEAAEPLPRCGFGLQVTRADGLVMFLGASNIDGVPEIDIAAGTRRRFAVDFRANLLRGTYLVDALLVDSLRTWPQVTLSGLASFVIDETTRVKGCAELEPQYELAALA
jgi:lipopolysaccharide transport system ATP-binding protein